VTYQHRVDKFNPQLVDNFNQHCVDNFNQQLVDNYLELYVTYIKLIRII
jgi:hypothetical protein